MTFNWWTLLLQIVNFAVLVWLLRRFLYQPVLRMIDARKAAVQKQFDDAKAAEDKAQADLAKIDAKRSKMAAERVALLKSAAAEADKAAAARRAQAESEADELVKAAQKTLADERARALAELRENALDLGAEFARRLLSEVPVQLRAEAWIERIEEHLKASPKAELKSLVEQFADGGALLVVTAAPLPKETAKIWQDRLRGLLGKGVKISFKDDPALVAGADLHFPTAVLRFSWQSALMAMQLEVGAHDNTH